MLLKLGGKESPTKDDVVNLLKVVFRDRQVLCQIGQGIRYYFKAVFSLKLDHIAGGIFEK